VFYGELVWLIFCSIWFQLVWYLHIPATLQSTSVRLPRNLNVFRMLRIMLQCFVMILMVCRWIPIVAPKKLICVSVMHCHLRSLDYGMFLSPTPWTRAYSLLKWLCNRPRLMQLSVNPHNTAVTALTSEDNIFSAHIISYSFHNGRHVVNRLVCCAVDPMCFA
jgi:hypothetical protein